MMALGSSTCSLLSAGSQFSILQRERVVTHRAIWFVESTEAFSQLGHYLSPIWPIGRQVNGGGLSLSQTRKTKTTFPTFEITRAKMTTSMAAAPSADVQHQLLRAREFCLLGDYDNGLPEFRRVLQIVQRRYAARVNPPDVQQVRVCAESCRYQSAECCYLSHLFVCLYGYVDATGPGERVRRHG